MSARMSPAEAVMLCRFAKAACPQQAFDEYTPDMWHELLSDLRFEDAKAALLKVVRTQPFCSPSEIRTAVKSVRNDRLLAFGPITPPAHLWDDVHAEIEWKQALRQRIADGELTREEWEAEQEALPARDMRVIEGTFRDVSE